MQLVLGRKYSRRQIHEIVGGGSLQSFLPGPKGRTLCGCFDPKMNKAAPTKIDFGFAPLVLKAVGRPSLVGSVIPIFLKRAPKNWEYVGNYRVDRVSFSKRDVAEARTRRRDTQGVIFLSASDKNHSVPAPEDLDLLQMEDEEGRLVLRLHLQRERSRKLLEQKRKLVVKQAGTLRCEVCGLVATDLPSTIGAACFEVHHLAPLSLRSKSAPTSIKDLALLCSNCHRMIHRSKQPQDLVGLRRLLLRPNVRGHGSPVR